MPRPRASSKAAGRRSPDRAALPPPGGHAPSPPCRPAGAADCRVVMPTSRAGAAMRYATSPLPSKRARSAGYRRRRSGKSSAVPLGA